MKLLKNNFKNFVDLISLAKKQIILSVPNISELMAISLSDIKTKNIDIHIFLEFSELTYRTGYGEIKSLEILEKADINILNKSAFNIYFIIVDDWGYFYFPKSSFIEEEGIALDLFQMESQQLKSLKLMFGLLDDNDMDFENIAESIGIDTLKIISDNITAIPKTEITTLESKFITDPPLKPIYGRTLEVYKAKFQYVELKFIGANFLSKKVKLPSKALPFKDMHLQKAIEANLKLFTDINGLEILSEFYVQKIIIERIRSQYLFHLKCRDKNIIIRDEKGDFLEKIEELKNDIVIAKENIINMLQSEINKSREQIKNNLFIFLKSNPPEEFAGLNEDNLENEIRNMVGNIISNIHFPNAVNLIKGMKLEYAFYDLTWEDLNNENVLKELLDKKLIDSDEKTYFDKIAIEAKAV
ncbi:MAG: hypothetical protein ACOYOV_12065 [Bacteroidales bacterium]